MATGISKNKWNGTAEDDSEEHTSSNDGFGMELSYPGKLPKNEILNLEPAEELVLLQGQKDSENRLFYGDNLSVLASLLQDASVCGQVRLVYIDPPFATKSIFKSRSQSDAYQDLLSGPHYIEFIRQRLVLIRELLADDGSIYIHLDENMAFHVKVIMDEVFGVNNFRNWITRKKCNPKNYTRKTYGNVADYILFYTKSDKYVWDRPYEAWTPERAKKEYQYIEEETGRRYKKVPVHAPGTRNGETGKPWRGKNPPPGKHWQYIPAKLDEMDARGEIYWSPNGNPRRKVYFDESQGVPIQDIWLEYRDAHNQNIKITGYPTEKNPDLLSRIIQASSQPGDIVLDCFSGSGTTLAEASKLNRRWIGIDNSQEAIRTTLERFSQGLRPMGDFVSKGKSKENQLQNQLPIFAPPENQTETEQDLHQPIEDFALFADEENQADLDKILETTEDTDTKEAA